PELHITPDQPKKVAKIGAYYALKNPVSFGRAWRDVELTSENGVWKGKMPVMNTEDYVFGFGNVHYNDTIVRSSGFQAAIPAKLGDAKATDEPSSDLSDSPGWMNTGPVQGKDNIQGFRVLSPRGTFNEQFSDPKWEAPEGSALKFKYYCTQPQTVTFSVNSHYLHNVKILASNDWQSLTLDSTALIHKFGKNPLKTWSVAKKIGIKPAKGSDITKVVFADFEWVAAEANPKPKQQPINPEPKPVLQVDKQGRVYLTADMAVEVDSFHQVMTNKSWEGKKISVGGKVYDRGLGVHADSKLVFALDGEFDFFHVIPGPDDAHGGKLAMKIFIDDAEVYHSGEVSSSSVGDVKAERHSVQGAQKLTLIVESLGSQGGDHASWVEAFLEKTKPETTAMKAKSPHGTLVPRDKIEPFLMDYCIDCHDSDTEKGQVNFDFIDWEIANNDSAQRWQDILDVLNGGEMPPEKKPQPSDDEMAAALDTLTGVILQARQKLTDHGGEIKMRRLNQREYSATINDLFGFEVAFDQIPENGDIESFDTVGDEQFFTSSDFEKYLELGRKVAKDAMRWNTSPHRELNISHDEPETRVTEKQRIKLTENDRRMVLKKEGKGWKEMGFKDEGEMSVLFDQWDSRVELPRKYLQLPKVDTGVYLSDIAKWASGGQHTDIRGHYQVRIHGGVVGDHHHDIRRLIRISDSTGIKGTLLMQGTPDAPETVSLMTKQTMGRFGLNVKVEENKPNFTQNTSRSYIDRVNGRGDHTDPRPSIWIDWIETEGPFYPEKRPRFEEILFPDKPTGHGPAHLIHHGKIRELLEKFAFEAFRRELPQPAFIDGLLAIYEENLASGKNAKQALEEPIAIVLASPSFLFINEAKAAGDRQRLTERELAIRLSYFLWSSPPDDELYELAEAGDLSNLKVLNTQIDRMLNDPRAEKFHQGFINQWAELDRYDAITVVEKDHPLFNPGIRHDAREEVAHYFGTMVKENQPISKLIDSDFAVVNPALALHYELGWDGFENSDFRKVKLPADSPRGGIVTQAAFLTTGSNGERSSPVIRGALVMEKVL
ncbi:MAG: DUF1592 domain-containing protein, partial [Verrucomicrobiota bacterium]